jgi:hypothetical protein
MNVRAKTMNPVLVDLIRANWRDGMNAPQIAQIFRLTIHQVKNIVAGKSWQTVGRGLSPDERPGASRGSRSAWAKLSEAKVRAARQRYAAGTPMMSLAREYGVSLTVMSLAINRKTWKHVAD